MTECVNGARGEVSLEISGKACTLCLTLGALAEIETALGCTSMRALDMRMRTLSAGDLLTVLNALLRGGNSDAVTDVGAINPAIAARAVADAFKRGVGA